MTRTGHLTALLEGDILVLQAVDAAGQSILQEVGTRVHAGHLHLQVKDLVWSDMLSVKLPPVTITRRCPECGTTVTMHGDWGKCLNCGSSVSTKG